MAPDHVGGADEPPPWPAGGDSGRPVDGRAPFEPEGGEEAARLERERIAREELERRFQRAVETERIIRQARRVVDVEEHAAGWRRPDEYDSLAAELALPDEPVTYRVDRVIPTGANVVLTAQFKAGKTTMVNHLVKVLTDGGDFLGRYPVQRVEGRVGIFNYEVGAPQYRRWLRDVGIGRADRVSMLHLRGLRLPLTVRDVEDYVVDWLKRHEVEVWILDPYARALVGSGEENDNSAVGVFLDTLDVIKDRAGVTELIMPAHTGRADHDPGKERARGATRLDDWPDVRWILVKGDDGRRYLTCSGRDVDEPEQALGYDERTRWLSVVGAGRRATQRDDLRMQVLKFIEANPGKGANELCAAFPAKRVDVLHALDAMLAGGLIRVESGPNRRKLHYPAVVSKTDVPWNQSDPQVGLF